jgi:hypothetical protein
MSAVFMVASRRPQFVPLRALGTPAIWRQRAGE